MNNNITKNHMNNQDIIHMDTNKCKILINKLHNYILNTKNLTRFTKYHNNSTLISKKENKYNKDKKCNKENKYNTKDIINTTVKPTVFNCPHFLKDKLFWSFYVIKMGIDKFNMVDTQHFLIEKEMKFKYIELLRSNKAILKIHKVKPLYEIEDELANKDKIGLKTFLALCLVDKINIVIINKRKVFECIHDDINEIHLINKTDDPLNYQLSLHDNTNIKEKLEYYRENYFQWTHIEMGLKSMTSYKLEDLVAIANKLNIDIKNENNKKKTKKEIYEILLLNF